MPGARASHKPVSTADPRANSSVLFITAFHPGGRGVIGAGEALSEDSLRALRSSGKTVHVLSLAPASQTANPEVVSLCQSYTTLEQTALRNAWGVLWGAGRGALFAPWLFARVTPRNIRTAREIIARFGIGEIRLDFPSTLAFAAHLRPLPIDYFVHDVVAQNIGRRRLLGMLSPLVGRIEGKLLSFVRRCLVLSQKDQDLLRGMAFTGEVILQPPVGIRVGEVFDARPVEELVKAFPGKKNLVFFGNMQRPENHWSILHFLLFAYPKIRRRHKDVRFWVVGLMPRLSLRLLGKVVPGVRVVGAVDDPYPAFKAAAVCVVPLRLGAGVKIKVLQMLDAGAKVVASTVGGEGIPASPNLTVVPYDEIPEAVCRVLSGGD